MSLFTLSLLKVPRVVSLHLKLHFQKNVFIHYNNYCFLNNIIILIKTKRYVFYVTNYNSDKILQVFKHTKCSKH